MATTQRGSGLAEPSHKGRPQAELTADRPRVLGVWLTLTLGQAWRQKLLPSGSQERGWQGVTSPRQGAHVLTRVALCAAPPPQLSEMIGTGPKLRPLCPGCSWQGQAEPA